ncbi:MAG: SUMF1/EgtB/PvdO family nonheme iron enzyme [Cytophagales bacterium]|nr:SUMF1/EgtB/PvdO family nonheme iron enzyme [Cytophagales bacterium]MDW8384683.1 SUMF1/EgtB/PvdO family nonheme iron enzyme [Flammeovirgaceae bacterium]
MTQLNLTFARLTIMIAVALSIQGCKRGGDLSEAGELYPTPREGWQQVVPYGMVVVPPGTFHMGQADEDITSSKINLNKQVTIGGFYMDDTEITNNEYRMFIQKAKEMSAQGDTSWTMTEDEIMEQLYPDTVVWINDFAYHMGDPLTKYYYDHPAFDNYPVVGVTWFAAKKFCEWRTLYLNNYRIEQGQFPMPNFRLPSEAEWEYAYRGGRDMAKFPWGGPYVRNAKGCSLGNFKPGRGNYYDDGYAYTAPVASYFANEYGLYDMFGNVAEWCEDAYHPASFPIVWDINPTYYDENEPRKIVRGGSWKDIEFYTESGTRSYEFQDQSRSFIGFRCVMTYLGRSAGTEF